MSEEQKTVEQIKTFNLHGPINSTGMGTHFFHWAQALSPQLVQRGINTCMIPKNGAISREEFASDQPPAGDLAIFMDALEQQAQMEHLPDIGVMCWHPHQLGEFAAKTRIGYTVFETTDLRPEEMHHLKQCDYVAIPTKWHKQVLIDLGFEDEKILIWPEGVDHKIFHPIPLEARLDQSNRGPLADVDCFTFVNVGKFEKRKGTPLLIEAFGQMADTMKDPDQPVRLLLSCYNPFIDQPRGQWQKIIATTLAEAGFEQGEVDQQRHLVTFPHSSNPSFRIDLVGGWLQSKNDVMMLYRAADAGVFPYFAEGWNLPLIEAMACGLPCLATFYSGPTEFLANEDGEPNTDIFLPLTEGREAVARDNIFFSGDRGNWFQVDQNHLVEKMQEMLSMAPGVFRNMGEDAASRIRSKWSWQQSARAALDSMIEAGLMR
jgi:glycosyltransferase involved in cell wall biosynthesis